ncbi:MAG TPA: response regulator [Bacteroidales bacterium]|nr:response regulator [Bacteroidales bacterium]
MEQSIKKAHILIAENSPPKAATLKNLLATHNYEISVVLNGKDAVNLVRKNKPDMVISNVKLQETDGYQFCQILKSDRNTKDVPVILMTSLSDSEEIIKGLDCGADSFVFKPYDENYLLSLVEKLLLSGEKRNIGNDSSFNTVQQKLIQLLINIYDNAVRQNVKLIKTQEELDNLKDNLKKLEEEHSVRLLSGVKRTSRIQEELKKNQTFLMHAHKMAHLGTWEYDFEHDTFYFNDPFYALFRTSVGQVGGYTMRSAEYAARFVHPEDMHLVELEIKKALQSNDPNFNNQVEHRFIYADGEVGYLNVRFFTIKDEDGRTVRTFGITQDITEIKKAEKELVNAKDKAEESDRLKTAFLHNISHEIRTPMNAIVGFSTLLSESNANTEKQKSYTDIIIESSEKLLSVISDIIDISNIDANIVDISKTEVTINSLVKETCEQFFKKAQERKIVLTFHSELEEDFRIATDLSKLTQILSNLIDNAIKFTYDGTINVHCKKTDKFIEFSITDTGIGIAEEECERIFERFYQVKTGVTRPYEGTGLGLAIAKAYTQILGGKIWMSSEISIGTSFFFTVPFEQITGNLETSNNYITDQLIFSEEKTILVAEDIESNFRLIEHFLSEANVKIIWALNGQEALDRVFTNNKIDLILMDIKLPVLDGYAVTRMIREAGINVPIIAQTAYTDDKEKAIEAGCSGYILKPYNRKKFYSAILEYLK